MANPLYQMLNGGMGASQSGAPTFSNPAMRMNYILQAMQNPAAFVKRAFPDIPPEIQNNPSQILSYLQQTRGINNQQIMQARQMADQIQGQGTVI